MKRNAIFTLLLVTVSITGCTSKSKDTSQDSPQPETEQTTLHTPNPDYAESILVLKGETPRKKPETITIPETSWDTIPLIKKLNVIQLPFNEDMNFNNYYFDNILNEEAITFLRLNSLLPYKNEVNLNYRVWYSNQFLSLVISYFKGENELVTLLVNYDKDYRILAYQQIAYDEIAESAIRIESEIVPDGFETIHTNYLELPPVLEKTTYKIKENGKIECVN